MLRSRRQAAHAVFGAVLGALLAATPASGPLRAAETQAGAAAAASHAEWRQTCRHYDNRARFLPRGAPGAADAPFLVRLADACMAALDLVEGPATARPSPRVLAETLLDRLTLLRLEVSAINRDRVFGASRDAADGWGAMGAVSVTGEYLIARHIGVTKALNAMSPKGMTIAGR